jgi:DNA-binding protein H-NS
MCLRGCGSRCRWARGHVRASRAATSAQASGQIPWSERRRMVGRGRKPNWLAALEAEGRGREEFLIQG